MKKNRKNEAPQIGRLGTEKFLSFTHKKAGSMKTGKRDVNRTIANRKAIAED